jgi:hypothetical protein
MSRLIKAYADPLFSKPESLGLDVPGFHYFGPQSDDGSNYGAGLHAYVCEQDNIGVIGEASEENLFCPLCGRGLRRVGRMGQKFGNRMGRAKMFMLPTCNACGKNNVTSVPMENLDNTMHCMHCGNELNIDTDTVSPVQPETLVQPLATLAAFSNVQPDDVFMRLYTTETDAFWNVEIQGQPIGRICLNDQENKEEIDAFFRSPQYQVGITGSICKIGLVDTLSAVKARLWNASVDVGDVYAQAKREINATVEQRNSNYLGDLFKSIALVCAGMDKNYFDMPNTLKAALAEEMGRYGLESSTMVDIIEAGFESGATDYFKSVLEKATEVMGYTSETRDQLTKLIANSGTIDPRNRTVGTLANELENNNFPLSTVQAGLQTSAKEQELRELFARKRS